MFACQRACLWSAALHWTRCDVLESSIVLQLCRRYRSIHISFNSTSTRERLILAALTIPSAHSHTRTHAKAHWIFLLFLRRHNKSIFNWHRKWPLPPYTNFNIINGFCFRIQPCFPLDRALLCHLKSSSRPHTVNASGFLIYFFSPVHMSRVFDFNV